MMQILTAALDTRYSRIPVYKGDVDNIIGVVFSKDLLSYMSQPGESRAAKQVESDSACPEVNYSYLISRSDLSL